MVKAKLRHNRVILLMPIPKKIFSRQHEITADFLKELDKHLLDIEEGRATEMFELRDFAEILHIHPRHLTDTVKHTTGNHPCYYFQEKILAIAKSRLAQNDMSIAQIAGLLTYDPSNFTKFFKKFTDQTPKQYRELFLSNQFSKKTASITI
jgi:AraC family transcriptional regulator of adaptative response / methylphosphotriester-DNA alkyltransferase methyltransferase